MIEEKDRITFKNHLCEGMRDYDINVYNSAFKVKTRQSILRNIFKVITGFNQNLQVIFCIAMRNC